MVTFGHSRQETEHSRQDGYQNSTRIFTLDTVDRTVT